MLVSSKHLIFVFLVVGTCAAKSIDPEFLKPCSIHDDKCVVELWKKAVKGLMDGRPEYNLPPLDPMKVDDVDVEVPGVANLRFTGYLKGIKNCIFEDAKKTFKPGHYKLSLDLKCNVTLKGHYVASANSSVLFNVGNGGNLKADGHGRVSVYNLKIKFLLDFDIAKDNGEVKFLLKEGPVGYRYNIDGPVTFAGNNIFLGDQDLSPLVMSFLNQNWRVVMDLFGGYFFNRAFGIIGDYEKEFFRNVPAKAYFIENLEQYA